jgi:hypothetical protein
MATGHIRAGFPWQQDGEATARRPGTPANFHRNTFWKHFAIWDTPALVTGRHRSAFATRCGSPSLLRWGGVKRRIPQLVPRAFFSSAMYASEITGPSNMANWNLICRKQSGRDGTTTPVSRKWRNAFLSRT